MRKKFNLDSTIFQVGAKIADVILLSLVWVICSLPLVTLGASNTAMYHVVVNYIRKENGILFADFFQVFKREFKQSTLFSLVLMTFTATCLLVLNAMKDNRTSVVYFAMMLLIFIPLMLLPYGTALISQFENRFSLMLKNTVLLALGNFPRTFVMGLLEVVAGTAIYLYPPLILIIPGTITFLISLVLEPILDIYRSE